MKQVFEFIPKNSVYTYDFVFYNGIKNWFDIRTYFPNTNHYIGISFKIIDNKIVWHAYEKYITEEVVNFGDRLMKLLAFS